MKKNLLRILLLVIGVLSIVLSIVAFSMNPGYTESMKTYGGDAYTGIQNAAAETANNLKRLAEIARFGFGSILLVNGAVMISGAVCMEGRKKQVPAAPAAYDYNAYYAQPNTNMYQAAAPVNQYQPANQYQQPNMAQNNNYTYPAQTPFPVYDPANNQQ